ncbi:MAG: HRDC domain-containing protein, partial [Pyrinomonadaceae bacterium]
LQTETLVGLDTETYWDANENRSHVSLVQIAPRAGEVVVIDAIAVGAEIFREIVESTEVTMAAHNARFDEAMLMGAGLRPAAFVDTLRLARTALRLPSYSLAGVCAHLFGIELDKSYQKSNWRRRPLSRAQINYAAKDANLSLRVYEELCSILAEQGRLEEALRDATLSPSTGEQGVPRTRRPKPALPRPLSKEEKKKLAQLKKWRLEKSRDARVPAYMICPDITLEQLAMERPRTLDALALINGLGPSRIARFGEELLKAVMSDE